ncbi:unnamed protein product [Aspergillus oryzae var. brunneus]|uniref:pectinesterase n=1 Tax=Aspergillus oryzae var. brunneus TaxID=332754 RepID=A0ABQ6KUV6_ASPOZ|nr:unnamed protein product [Aspergillus oryzae var. brunneus]
MVKSLLVSGLFAATALAASRMTAPAGAIVVAKSGGDYDTLSAAVNALSTTETATQTIFIEEGTYDEQVYIPSLAGKLIIYGQTEDDFIFGQHARAWFQDCDIRVLKGPSSGYITANGRSSETDTSYYVIHKSSVAAADGNDVPSGTYYLGTSYSYRSYTHLSYLITIYITGRPWSQYARVLFQETSMTDVINSAGWSVWSTTQANTENVTFAEYGNTGAGAEGTRASFSEKLSEPVAISTILGSDWAQWVDTSYIN